MENIEKTCNRCGITKPLDSFYSKRSGKYGRGAKCKECEKEIRAKNRQEHRKERNKHQKEYYKKVYREKSGHKPMDQNKSCTQYLGIVVGERLCRHLFKDVEVMPMHNPGFDFICNRGKLIDVKTSSTRSRKNKKPYWVFEIKRNTTADYFICVAFDNRTDLNPLHMWMIPGKEINHLRGISIFLSTIHKWDKWKRDIDDAQLCCTEMKEESESE